MAKIINHARGQITLPTRHVVPRLGELVTTNEIITCPDNWPMLNAMATAGDIGLEMDPDQGADNTPTYATDEVAQGPLILSKTPVYATDAVEVVAAIIADTPVYATDPVNTEADAPAEAPVYATDPVAEPEPVAEAIPAAIPDAITGPVDVPADAVPAKAKK